MGFFNRGFTQLSVRKTTSCQRGTDEVGEERKERKEIRSNRAKNVRGDIWLGSGR